MPTTDTSMYSSIPLVQPQNPLSLVQGYASASQALTANKLQQNELGAQQDMSRIISQGTNPDGTRDYGKINQLIQQSPYGAIIAPKLLGMQQQQESPNQVFNGKTGKYEYRNLQDIQRTAVQQRNSATGGNALTGGTTTIQKTEPMSYEFNEKTGDPSQQQGPPPIDQDTVDELHAHNRAMIDTLEPLANDPNPDQQKVTKGIVDLVAHPDAKFNATDAATVLSGMPHGPGGVPPTSQQLKPVIQQHYQQQKQNEAILSQHYPSSQQLQAQQVTHDPAAGTTTVQTTEPMSHVTNEAAPQQNASIDDISPSSPPGWTSPLVKSRQNYDEVGDEAKNAPGTLTAYNEVINLNKAGALTGSKLGQAYQAAAKYDPSHILIPEEATTDAAKSEQIQKWMANGLLSRGMPGSDQRLQELQHGNLSPDQLSATVKELAPFFKAVAQGNIEKLNFYNRATHNGNDMSAEPAALEKWTNNYDPRWIELDNISSPAEKSAFLAKHPDMIDKQEQHDNLQAMGVIKGRKTKASQ